MIGLGTAARVSDLEIAGDARTNFKFQEAEMKTKRIFTVMLVVAFALGMVSAAFAFDINAYRGIVKQSVRQILKGSLTPGDVDQLITNQEKLIDLGVQASREHVKMNPKDAKLLNLAINNVDSMKSMTVKEMMTKWHKGGFLKANGIDFDSLDHFSPSVTIMYTIIHPATAYDALEDYKNTKNEDDLETVKDQLSTVLEHLDYIENHLKHMQASK